MSGILVFSDKVIDEDTANEAKEWIRMTKVGRLFAEEKEEAIEEKVKKIVLGLLKEGVPEEKIISSIPELSLNDVREIAKTI